MIQVRRVFIVVKTYPTLSKKYDELVCTAGILDDGGWVRIYPLPFRKLEYDQRYKKFQWLELPLVKNTGDIRPESYQVMDRDRIKLIGNPVKPSKKGWEERRRIIFPHNTPVYNNLTTLIGKAHDNKLSLATFKPTRFLDFIVKPTSAEWSKEKLKYLEQKSKQYSLFQTPEEVKKEFMVVDKVPYKFSYKIEDVEGRQSTMMILDWEIGMLYFKCLKRAAGNAEEALEKVRMKYWDTFLKTDLHLFLGTTKQFHSWGSNPFVIIGVFPPPKKRQLTLF